MKLLLGLVLVLSLISQSSAHLSIQNFISLAHQAYGVFRSANPCDFNYTCPAGEQRVQIASNMGPDSDICALAPEARQKKCCMHHHVCYSTCNRTVVECDDTVVTCLKSLCHAELLNSLTDNAVVDPLKLRECDIEALVIGRGLAPFLSCDVYQEIQATYCPCQ